MGASAPVGAPALSYPFAIVPSWTTRWGQSKRLSRTIGSAIIVPTLTVDDLQKSSTFYEALGFAIDER